MKKICSIVLLLVCLTMVGACGAGSVPSASYTVDDILGKWLSEEKQQVLEIKADGTTVFLDQINSKGFILLAPPEVKKNQVDLTDLGTYTVTNIDGILQMTCNESTDNETLMIEKDTVFVKTEDIYAKEDFQTEWVNEANGDTLSYNNNTYTLTYSGGTSSVPGELAVFVGDKFYIYDMGSFTVVEENDTMKLVDGDTVFTRKADLDKAAAANREAYADVYADLTKETWLFNGGGDTLLNYIEFQEGTATVGQVYVDENGWHDGGSNEGSYSVDDTAITVETGGGSLTIPYTKGDSGLTLDQGKYMTLSEVEEGLQGYWTCSYNMYGQQEKYLYVDHGKIQSESASEAAGGGGYYYYGPYDGSYTMGIGQFDTDMFKGSNWGYNIIDGVPTVLNYTHICVPADGFPGEDGYSF